MGDTGDTATTSKSRSQEVLMGGNDAKDAQPNALQAQANDLLLNVRPEGDRVQNILRANGLDGKVAPVDPKTTALDHIVENNRLARLGLLTVEGAGYAVPGVVNTALHDITHPVQAIEKGSTALALGVAMRIALPKAGAARAAAATAFTYFMVRDAAVPVAKGFSEAWDAKDHAQVNAAAQKMGDGLGMFAWDSYWGMKIAMHGERLGEKGMKGILGEQKFNAFETAKGDYLGSDKYFFGRQINRLGNAVDKGTQTLADKLSGRLNSAKENPLTFEQKMAKAQEAHGEYEGILHSHNMHKHGIRTTDGKEIGFDQTIGIFLAGKDPRKMTSEQISEFVKAEGEAAAAKPKPADATAKPTDNTPVPGSTPELAARIAAEVNPKNIELLAKMAKDEMNKLTDEQQQVIDLVEGSVGPVHAALNPNHKALDPGYREWLTQMVGLANEVGGDTQKLQQVAPLFFRGRDAAIGQMSADLGPTGANVHSMNLFSLELYTGSKTRMNQKNIPADEVLSAKNPPLNLVARDNGAGPHTIPEIQGVWDVDLVQWPRNMQSLRMLRAGINGHENNHNQYGGIMRFPDSIREQVINGTVRKALGDKSGEMVDVPGHGKMSKLDLVIGILKAQANENTADIGGAAYTGPNGGTTLGVLLQALRQDGKLETRNVFGKEMASAENPMGIEVHSIDTFRPKLIAEVLRQRGEGDPLIMEYAKQLDAYAEVGSRGEKDYVWASIDNPGQKITISRAELDAVIPHLVSAQLNTPLDALKGKTFADILPHLPTEMKKMDQLSNLMVDAIVNKKPLESIPFHTQDYTMIQLQNSAMPTALRLMDKGMTAEQVNAEVNRVSDFLEMQFHTKGDPHIAPINAKPSIAQLALNPSLAARQTGKSLSSAISGVRDWSGRDRFIYGYGGMAMGRDMFSTYVPGSQVQSLINEGRKQAGATPVAADATGGGIAPVEAQDPNRDAKGRPVDLPADKVVVPNGDEKNAGSPRDIPKPVDPWMKGLSDRKPSTIDYNELRRMQQQGEGLRK